MPTSASGRDTDPTADRSQAAPRRRIAIGGLSDFEPGTRRLLEADGRKIVVFRLDDGYTAIEARCPHMGGPLEEAPLRGSLLTCPWHRWRFDLSTGCSPLFPFVRLKTLKVEVEGDVLMLVLD